MTIYPQKRGALLDLGDLKRFRPRKKGDVLLISISGLGKMPENTCLKSCKKMQVVSKIHLFLLAHSFW